ncbi:SWIM zinc finger family protein [Paenibacillus sp. OAS669]|uniref:SWIM zinc finger family protein n=1 Tax=Paenibacillus sp. OAS669 TaxID=2663821 RepID=UPI00178A62B6|nr:SWIM zinc finger family protein [Paenibacillus sp. OAS669]MBE1446863.1 hypothetical protein [Paenibacillus sp. OAS669]
MVQLTEAYVDSLALNSAAIKNGKDLVKKNSFPLLCKSEDHSVLFGECKGSGKEPYRCSVDWANEGSPVFRCSCPSRQFPCKHNLGLMYAYTAGNAFEIAPIPADLAEKREKAEKREEKKREAAASGTPPTKKKTNKAALVKKIAAQLEGIAIAEKLVLQLAQQGLGSLDKKALQTADEQAKELGNYYIPGIQTAIRQLTEQLRSAKESESAYPQAIEQLTMLHSLLHKSKAYLNDRLENPDLPADSGTILEERIGHAWQMAELREQGRVRTDVELLQLAFRSYSEPSRGEYVDEGYWFDLHSGQIHITRTYRPFRATKYIREEDSTFQVVRAKELAEYPGELNQRVRWEEAVFREVQPQDYIRVVESAEPSFKDLAKRIKNQIKNPLSDKNPVALLRFKELHKTDTSYVLIDSQGSQLPLADIPYVNEPTTPMLPIINRSYVRNQTMLVMFGHNMERNRLEAQPLSIVTADNIIRLLY